jgi:hypothetical protein
MSGVGAEEFLTRRARREDLGFGFIGLKPWRSWWLGGEKMIHPEAEEFFLTRRARRSGERGGKTWALVL